MRTYVVWCPDLGQEQEDGATIPATDPDDAAEAWAEWHDRSSAEYRIASGAGACARCQGRGEYPYDTVTGDRKGRPCADCADIREVLPG